MALHASGRSICTAATRRGTGPWISPLRCPSAVKGKSHPVEKVLLQQHDNLGALKAAEEASHTQTERPLLFVLQDTRTSRFELFRQVGDRVQEAQALFLVSQAGVPLSGLLSVDRTKAVQGWAAALHNVQILSARL